MLYLWVSPPYCIYNFVALYNEELSPSKDLFLQGKQLENGQINKKAIFDLHDTLIESVKYNCLPNNINAPLVSQRIINYLYKLAPDDVQFFDADIYCKDGILTGYKVMNITRTNQNIVKKPVCEMIPFHPPEITGFDCLAYEPECMGNYQLARVKNYSNYLVVTKEIRQAFLDINITGVRFIRFDNYLVLSSEKFEEVFYQWLIRSLNEDVPTTVKAFCFLLSYPAGWHEIEFSIQLIGASLYDPNDSDWPCEEIWEPTQRYLFIPKTYSTEDMDTCQAKMKNLIERFLHSNMPIVEKLKQKEAIGISYVDGDLELIWENPIKQVEQAAT